MGLDEVPDDSDGEDGGADVGGDELLGEGAPGRLGEDVAEGGEDQRGHAEAHARHQFDIQLQIAGNWLKN